MTTQKRVLSLATVAVLAGGAVFAFTTYDGSAVQDKTNSTAQVKVKQVSTTNVSSTPSIQKLMSAGMVQTYPGDPALKKNTFRVDPIVLAAPKELKLKEKDGYRYITVPLILHDKEGTSDGYSVYRPNAFSINDGHGHDYAPVDYISHNKKAWKYEHQYIAPNRLVMDVVYHVPKNANTFVMFASSDAFPKTYTVKISID
ncbi:hypothetical protein [Exiguobacterium sp. s193]|uniref:hypothetical protein n=1 Tax=Exiguobacterium sp. s193 TaxID=2751207 RepID=UPI001BEADAC5|nr:hypothetical protein [Exiguobacterium sp. s193]